MSKKICSMCGQKMDVYTTAHKSSPFADGRPYATICFTCYFVPKIMEQTYDQKGYVLNEIEIDYSCDNLNTAEELYKQGTSDTLSQAKKCVEAVKKACDSAIGAKKQKTRPKATWNLC